jgi:predicted RNA-binding protein (virulence factor B family)
MRIIPGKIQKLPLLEPVDRGYLLGSAENNVFISKRDVRAGTEPDTEIEVFVFYNELKELEATSKLPQLQLGEVGCFRVGNSNDLGAFIDIGSRRDILIPHKEQVEGLETGRMTLVVLCDDQVNRRLYASTKLNRHLRNEDIPYKRGDEVQLTIAEKIEIGRRVVIDGKFIGALFRQEMMDRVRLGEKVKGFVRKVEGKDIIVSMQREGLDLLEDSKARILDYLEGNGGYVRLNDDTDPEEIKLRLHMSKKTFKRAAGMLFKEGKVLLTKLGIKINKTGEIPEGWENHKFLAAEDAGEEKKPSPRRTDHPRSDERSPDKDGSQRNRRDSDEREQPRERKYTERSEDRRATKPQGERKSDERKTLSQPKADSEKKAGDSRKSSQEGEKRDHKPVKQLTFKGKK